MCVCGLLLQQERTLIHDKKLTYELFQRNTVSNILEIINNSDFFSIQDFFVSK